MIPILADIHAHNYSNGRALEDGTNSRLRDVLETVKRCAQAAKKQGCSDIVFLGDIFHSRRSVEHTVLDRVIKMFRTLGKNFENVYVLTGNHDMSLTGDGSLSIRALEVASNVKVIDRPSVLPIGRLNYGFIPYLDDSEELEKVIKRFVHERVDYVFGHLGLLGGLVGPSDFEMPGKFSPKQLHPEKFRHVFLGHYHKHQTLEDYNITYIGSPLQLSRGERNDGQKGFVLLDEDSGEFSLVPDKKAPRFLDLEMTDLDDDVKISKNDFVKIEADSEQAAAELAERFQEYDNVNIDRVREVHDETERIELAGKGDREMLEEYVNERPPLDLPDFLKGRDVDALLTDTGMQILETIR